MDKRCAFREIARRLKGGEITFPTTAQVALKLRQALNDPQCSLNTVIKLVQAEPLLATRVVAMANSIVFNPSGREIADVSLAVNLLGFNTVRSLAVALVTRQMAGHTATQLQQELSRNLWEHTAHVAALAHSLAYHSGLQDPETAMFAGIVHEIGGFYLISLAEEYPALLDGDYTEWMEEGEAEVTRAIIRMLSVPESVAEALEGYWEGFMAVPARTLADILLIAEELASVDSPLHHLAEEGDAQGEHSTLEMAIGKETLTQVLHESAEEVASLSRALQL